ncbi:TNF receptor-associated factor family protein DDB_G0290883-like [Schistocerca gregaria]|uniref:TNF receptor-associated factor family protein DDB_G0290883-like n=1 Tax=Schistocerca gregaria TaxID=7010 RepID=UPI00211EB2B4|nr:TNF receptor-associated factor family protein DDB_G0290883-like [Schistocerca gregaria]
MSAAKAHEYSCSFAPINCPYSKSCGIMKRQELSGHIDVCEYRPVECENCHLYIQHRDLEKHRLKCEEALVSCQFCTEMVKRSEMERHLRLSCAKKPRECPYRPYGCASEAMLSEDLELHLKHRVDEHLQQVCVGFEAKMLELENRFQKLLLEKNEQIEELQRSAKSGKLRLCWNLSWSSVNKRYYVSSETFLVRGFQFYLGVFPRGDPEVENSREYVSLYLFINLKKNPASKCSAAQSIFLDWVFRIVNKKSRLTVAKRFESWFPVKGGEGWGEARMIEASKISRTDGFLSESGTLQIECDIQVIQMTLEI